MTPPDAIFIGRSSVWRRDGGRLGDATPTAARRARLCRRSGEARRRVGETAA